MNKIEVKTIPGFPNYAISKSGRVWSKPRISYSGQKLKGRWLKHGIHSGGYYVVNLTVNFYKYNCYVHRLVLETYIGPCPVGMECRHLDGNKQNIYLSNLKWGTKRENSLDKIRHGTETCGEKHGMVKLTEQNVRMIIYMYRTGLFLQREIAEIYNVSRICVTNILNKKRWRHLWANI